MLSETRMAAEFYATARGEVAAWLLRERLARFWPGEASGAPLSFLGVGHAAPYLDLWKPAARRCIALTPSPCPSARWPDGGASLSCAAEEDALPFPDLCFDRILLVHGLEVAENARRLLREIWRVLKDDGRLLVVAPNRRGMWAHLDSTPFGQGAPFSPRQIGRLLAASMFTVERRDTALYLPPSNLRLVHRSAALWEAGGRVLAPRFAGVIISEAVKDVYAALPVAVTSRRRVVLADAA